ncbi:MAG: DUF4335 domain-containing protein [Elainella sp. Prado103]|jgi:hypothetical protein|nr:DUF4335 domain-containing protein [Elainella sp. Prado103]
MPTAVLRRYTPPTCTLEIAATQSALSYWADRTVIKDIQFQLSFDDPKLPPEQQITVSGDRSQLDALCEVVQQYTQQFLSADPTELPWEASLQPHLSQVQGSQSLKLQSPESHPSELQPSELQPSELQPSELQSPESPPSERPSPEVQPIPILKSPILKSPILKSPITVPQPESWSLDVSPHPGSATLLNLPTRLGIQLQPQGLLAHRLQLGSLATEESGSTVRLTALQLFDLANALEAYQTDTLSLPALVRPAWMTKLPRPWAIAAAAILALGATGTIAKFILDIATPTVQTASAPQEREVNSELGSELFPALSPPPVEASPSVILQPLPPPVPPSGTVSDGAGLPPVGVTQPPPQPVPQPGVQSMPQPNGQPVAPGTDPAQVTIIPDPTIATAPSQSLAESSRSAEPPRLAESTESLDSSIAAAPPNDDAGFSRSGSTAFDTIPQVAEVRDYFQQNWQPGDLTQTLEYRLLLSADGSLQRIVPLGRASEQYIDRTNMPLMGEPFVSATEDGATPQIRLVLKPDGKVQTFLEYAN